MTFSNRFDVFLARNKKILFLLLPVAFLHRHCLRTHGYASKGRDNGFSSNLSPGHKSDRRPVAVITGGTRGIGYGIARVLASRGYDLILTFNTNKDAAEVSASNLLMDYPECRLECVGGDMTLVATRDRLFDCLDVKFCGPDKKSRLEVLVHNAGQEIGVTSDNTEGLGPETVIFGDGSILHLDKDGVERPDLSVVKYYQSLYGDAWIDLCERSLKRMTSPSGGSIVGISSPCVNPALYRPDRFYSGPGAGKTIME